MDDRQHSATTSFHSAEPASSSTRPTRGRKDTPPRKHITVACNACRLRKYKCNGDRPVCTGCQDRGTECIYDADSDSTRASTLKRKYDALETETMHYRALAQLLREAPPPEAEAVLGKLRSGQSVTSILGPNVAKQERFAGLDQEVAAIDSARRLAAGTNETPLQQLLQDTQASTQPESRPNRDERMQISNLLTRKASEEEVQHQDTQMSG
ncbi:fungal Zn(2)-Cys(6) binuclear cluster domain-containing protein 4 [Elsinoe australis]|uniref:Fungal Zn(2)-Cys(6) binuclear cluster domain-containing protein 4 n=1 Tax=Elsinoe australis TaxID=40998 RepID=A0A4U7BAW3_9PEZI|nr:fungal Zn(2)-Cys(6) binuclear cluster domain-containing protein 4 [Elsinoe australis]